YATRRAGSWLPTPWRAWSRRSSTRSAPGARDGRTDRRRHEEGRRDREAPRPGRGEDRAAGGGGGRDDDHRGQGIRAPEGPHRDLSRQRVQGGVPPEGQGRGRAARRPRGQGGGGRRQGGPHRQVRRRQGVRELALRSGTHPHRGAGRSGALSAHRNRPGQAKTRGEPGGEMSDGKKRVLRSLAFGIGAGLIVFGLRATASLAQEPQPTATPPQLAEPAAAPAAAPAPEPPAPKGPDPTGAVTGTAADVPVKDAAKPTLVGGVE